MGGFGIGRLLEQMFLPPGGPILLGIAGAIIEVWHRPAGTTLVATSLVLLYAASVPGAARVLMRSLQIHGPLDVERTVKSGAGAIVVLSADRRSHAPEYGGQTVSAQTLERLRYAARVHRMSGLPILASGGGLGGEGPAEAAMARDLLHGEFGVGTVWLESESRNTRENAWFSSRILTGKAIRHVILVTHAYHMPRAMRAFERCGIQVSAAPTGFRQDAADWRWPLSWLPSPRAARWVSAALHEIVGARWYAVSEKLLNRRGGN